jgi:uncharacterized protein (TIGR00369 family)
MSHTHKLEKMYLDAPINRFYRPTIAIGARTCEVSIAVSPEYFHAANSIHGSVYFKLLDDASFFAVSSIVEDVFVYTTSFVTYITRPVSAGHLTAKGRVVHEGKTLFLAEAHIEDANGKEVARGNGSFMRSRVPLGPEIGYRE